RGAPTVRMHDGERLLREGDVVGFPRGPEGGHQIRNESDEPARVLIVSTILIPMSPSTTAARSASGSAARAGSNTRAARRPAADYRVAFTPDYPEDARLVQAEVRRVRLDSVGAAVDPTRSPVRYLPRIVWLAK